MTKKINSSEKAKERWEILRKSIRSVSELVDKSDLKNNKISHGVQFLKRIGNNYEIDQVSYLIGLDSYMLLDGHSVRLLDSEGRYRKSFIYEEIETSFKRLQWANISERFIAWTPGSVSMAMLDKNFQLLEVVDVSESDDPIVQLLYNEDRNEIISSHRNQLVTWQFRYANKHLMEGSRTTLTLKDGAATIFDFERTASKFQRLFVADDCGVVIVRLASCRVVAECPRMHERLITALVFFNPLKQLVTGCKDGSIKVWRPGDDGVDLQMVFVGHTAPVIVLAPWCQATVVSCGGDRTLRVWSLAAVHDEVECIDLEESPRFVGVDEARSGLFTLGRTFVDLWRQNHVVDDLAMMTSPATALNVTAGDTIFGQCRNNVVFLASGPGMAWDAVPRTVVSRTLLPELDKKEKLKVLSGVILDASQTLFVLTNKNLILQYNTSTNPMKLKHRSQCNIEDNLLKLSLYKVKNYSKGKDKSLLMSGSSRGYISVHELTEPANTPFRLEAHSNAAIINLLSNPINSKLFSAGYDNTIKVWHVYPFASEPLSMEMSFFCGHLPIHLANIGHHLFTVFQDEEGAQFPAVVYNISDRNRYDHSPNDDHHEPVNSVSSARRMKLFLSASSGTENVIKIWTTKNVLLRQIEVHSPLHSSVFWSARGDILVSVGSQMCQISHNCYLPRAYIKKQLLMCFDQQSPTKEFKNTDFNTEECKKMFTVKDCDLLNGIKPVFKYQNYEDQLPAEEAQEVAERNFVIKQSYEKIQSTEEDIRQLQLGLYEKRVSKLEKIAEKPKKTDILNAYVAEFIKFQNIPLPKDLTEDALEIKRRKLPDKYKSSEKDGFFPSYKSINKTVAAACVNINPSGYLPNSVILNQLWPQNLIRDNAEAYKSPMLSTLDRALARLREMPKVEDDEEDSPKFFDWGSDDEDVKEAPESPILEDDNSQELSDDVLSKYSSLLKEPNVTVLSTESVINEPEPTVTNSQIKRPVTTTMSRETLKLPTISRNPATMPELRKVRFRSPSNLAIEPETNIGIVSPINTEPSRIDSSFFITESRVDDRPKLTSVSVLPRFLVRFTDEKWFKAICPPPHDCDACLVNLPTPLTATNVCKLFIQHIQNKNDPDEDLSVVVALGHMYSIEDIDRMTVASIHTLLEKKLNALQQLDTPTKIELLKTCLKLMVTLEGVSDKSAVLVCLSRYFDADNELRLFLKSLLCHLGLEDDDDIINKELNNFKLYSVQTGPNRIFDLQIIVSEWLQKWFQAMLNFATESRNMIGEEMHLLNSSHFKPSNNVSLQLQRVMEIFHLNVTNPVDLMQLYPTEKCTSSVLTYVNCLNFARFKLSTKKSRQQLSKGDSTMEDGSTVKKTIVSLPKLNPDKQCLVRLGESNANKIDAIKRKDFSLLNSMWSKTAIADCTQHPAMQPFYHYQLAVGGGFVPYLHLHMKPCLVNPFPHPEDIVEWESVNSKSLLLNAKHSFIHQFSLPPEPF